MSVDVCNHLNRQTIQFQNFLGNIYLIVYCSKNFLLACQCDYFYSTGNCMEETGICECRKAFQPPNCDTCAYGYYGYPNCRECECNLNGTDGYHCEAINGECPCKINFAGHYCKQCAEGYYSFPECKGKVDSIELNEIFSQ